MTSCIATPLRGPVSMRVPFAATSAGRVRHALESWLVHHQVDGTVLDDARLVMSELIGNVVKHASPLSSDTFLVRWRIEKDRLLISVCDGGGDTAPERMPADVESLGGRGLAIVDAVSDSWWVERTQQMHAVHVRLDLA